MVESGINAWARSCSKHEQGERNQQLVACVAGQWVRIPEARCKGGTMAPVSPKALTQPWPGSPSSALCARVFPTTPTHHIRVVTAGLGNLLVRKECGGGM